MKGKSGLIESGVIFIILNIIFFILLSVFIFNMSGNELVYEQTYSKQVALIVDSAKPNMSVSIDVTKINEIAKENEKNIEEVFFVDNENNKIIVSLNKKGGYEYRYFSDYNVSLSNDGKYLNIIIK